MVWGSSVTQEKDRVDCSVLKCLENSCDLDEISVPRCKNYEEQELHMYNDYIYSTNWTLSLPSVLFSPVSSPDQLVPAGTLFCENLFESDVCFACPEEPIISSTHSENTRSEMMLSDQTVPNVIPAEHCSLTHNEVNEQLREPLSNNDSQDSYFELSGSQESNIDLTRDLDSCAETVRDWDYNINNPSFEE